MGIKFGSYTFSFHRPDWAISNSNLVQRAKRNQAPDPDMQQQSVLFFKRKRQIPPELRDRLEYQQALKTWTEMTSPSGMFNKRMQSQEPKARRDAQRRINQWIKSGEHGPLRLAGLGLSMLPPLPAGVTEVDFTRNALQAWPDPGHLPETLRTLTLTENPLDYRTALTNDDYVASLASNRPALTMVFGTIRVPPPSEDAGKSNRTFAGVFPEQGIRLSADAPLSPQAASSGDLAARNLSQQLRSWIASAPGPERQSREAVAQAILGWHARYAAGKLSGSADSKGKARADAVEPLVLENMGITTCPPLPDGVVEASLKGNHVTRLPKMSDMPDTLRSLDLTNNSIAHIDSAHVASGNDRLLVMLGEIQLTRDEDTLLQEAYPGPSYSYTSTPVRGESSMPRQGSVAASGDDAPEARPAATAMPPMVAPAGSMRRRAAYAEANEALKRKDLDTLIKILGAYPAILKWQDSEGQTLLHYAAQNNFPELVSHLLSNSEIRIDLLDREGRSPLHYAAISGNGEIVRALVQKALQLERDGSRPLRIADQHTWTPLHYATKNVQYSAALIPHLLKFMGGRVNQADSEGNTALDIVIQNQDLAGLQALLASEDLDINRKDRDGNTALIKAVVLRRDDLASCLLGDVRLQINSRNNVGNAAIHQAVISNSETILRVLLRAPGIDVNLRGENGLTPLHYAASAKLLPLVQLLLRQNQIDINAPDVDGFTPLHMLATQGVSTDRAVLEALLRDSRTKVNLANNAGTTAYRIARENSNTIFTEAFDALHGGGGGAHRSRAEESRSRPHPHPHPHPQAEGSGARPVPPVEDAVAGSTVMDAPRARQLMGLDPEGQITIDEVNRAYRQMALQKHPDKNPERRVKAEAEFKELTSAKEFLSKMVAPRVRWPRVSQ